MLTKTKKEQTLPNLSASELTKSALLEFSYKGIEAWRNNNVRAVAGRTFTGKKGVSDIIGYNKQTGVFVVAEVKAGNDKLSQDQINFLCSVKQSGGFSFVVHEFNHHVRITEITEYLVSNYKK